MKQTMKYNVCRFPSKYGTPWKTNKKWIAITYAILRNIANVGMSEIRVINKETGKHEIVWN